MLSMFIANGNRKDYSFPVYLYQVVDWSSKAYVFPVYLHVAAHIYIFSS